VTEALTNVAMHSDASRVGVSVGVLADRLYVRVTDDGRGGAHIGKGHGLTGLADRLAGVDGTLTVTSPTAAGTIVEAEIPISAVIT
jgi:signal transduction histidine kinase